MVLLGVLALGALAFAFIVAWRSGGAVFPAVGTVDGGKPEIGSHGAGRAGAGGVFLA